MPALDGKNLAVQVLFDGQPVADAEVLFVDPAGEHHEVKADAQGKVSIAAKPGAWAVRSSKVENGKGGERDGNDIGGSAIEARLVKVEQRDRRQRGLDHQPRQ